ncbi:MAG: NADH-quinone oxidoreductase subunit NuoE [Anaerolineae bacterium]|nr:NADH-quinone oxidoreductase subunit NuoE [Anaerolineae bacterium]
MENTILEPREKEERLPRLNSELWKYCDQPGQLIPLLQAAQETYGYISESAIKHISAVSGVPESEIYGVITFYKQFRLRPLGKYLIRLCDGTACHVNNAKMLKAVVEDELGLSGSDTTEDGLFTLAPVACLGCCSLAPVVMINDMTYGRLTPQKLRTILRKYKKEGQAADSVQSEEAE